MRVLHTSDWHLGRSFHRVDLLAAQAGFLDHLVEVVVAERVDLVVVAGDVYDRALPCVDAVALCDHGLRRLRSAGAQVVVISGNHDSARRLGFAAELIAAGGVHIRTAVERIADPVLLADQHGPVAVYAVPYLEPELVRDQLGVADGRGHDAVLRCATAAARADLAGRPGTRSVVLAHAFVTGGAASDSERDISVGGVCAVSLDVFAGFDYVALGHLHGAQVLVDSVRYSGSPLAYSFSEAAHRKSSWLVELGATGVTEVARVPCPVPRRLATVTDRLETLLSAPGYAELENCFLSVTLTDAARPDEPMAALRRRFPHTVCLDFSPDGGVDEDGLTYAGRLRGRTDLEVAGSFVAHVRNTAAEPAELALLQAALQAQRLAGVSR